MSERRQLVPMDAQTMKTTIFYVTFAVGFLSILFSFYCALKNTNKYFLWGLSGGVVILFGSLFWLWPAVNDTWERIEIERQRIELKTVRSELQAERSLAAERRAELQKLNLQLDAQQVAQQAYSDATIALLAQIRDLRVSLEKKGIISASDAISERPPRDASPTTLLKSAKAAILTLYNLEVDQEPARRVLGKAAAVVQRLRSEWPDHEATPTNWQPEVVKTSANPSDDLERLLDELANVRGNSKFLNTVYAELNSALADLQAKKTIKAPAQRSSLSSFLASEKERQEFVLQAVGDLKAIEVSPQLVTSLDRSLAEIERITSATRPAPSNSVAPAGVGDLFARLDRVVGIVSEGADLAEVTNRVEALRSKFQAQGINVVLADDRRLAIGRALTARERASGYILEMLSQMHEIGFGVGSVRVPDPTSSKRAASSLPENLTSTTTESESGRSSSNQPLPTSVVDQSVNRVLFRVGAYDLEDVYIDLIRPLIELRQQLERSGRTASLIAVRVKGFADQKGSTNRLYRSDILPIYLRQEMQKGQSTGVMSDLTYVQNNHLPNLRAQWIARIVGQILPFTKVETVEGEFHDGTAPQMRTAELTFVWKE